MTPQGHIPASTAPGAHEESGVDSRLIRKVGGFIGMILVLLLVAVFLLLRAFEHRYGARSSEASPRVTAADLPPAPRPQAYPLRDLHEIRAAEDLHLNHYGWVDRPRGVARIPIERARDLWLRNYFAEVVAPTTATELQMRQQKAREVPHVP